MGTVAFLGENAGLRKFLKYRIKRPYYSFWVRRAARKVGGNLRVNARTVVNRNTTLGNNFNTNGLIIRGQGDVQVGDNFHAGPEVLFLTQFHNYDTGTEIPYDDTFVSRPITIGDNVWLGARVIVLAGAVIEEGAIIQAGSVVVDKIPRCGIAGGHPAQVFKYRDIDHYDRLKAEGKFR